MFVTSALSLGLALLPSAFAAVHDIQVGGEGGALVYVPEAIFAEVGDQVVFHFNPKNHTVTQSSFADPCGLKEGGFDSGFIPVAANTSVEALPTYTIHVENTDPIWVYCKQANKTPNSHCGKGMVFAVNCGADDAPNSFTNFKASALAAGESFAAAAAASSSVADPYATATHETPATTWTAAYGGVTVPAEPAPSVVTETVTLDHTSIWTTTYSSYAGSPAPTPASAEGNVILVKVGADGLVFDPPRINAQPRDTVVFEFHAKNHTVTQSSFVDPCRKLTGETEGFDSGFFPVDASLTEGFPTWNLTINDTAPIWAYCKQKTPASHCGAGMVFAINSNEESQRNYSAFVNLAKQLNGTSESATTGTTTDADAALSVRVGAAGFATVIAVLAFLL